MTIFLFICIEEKQEVRIKNFIRIKIQLNQKQMINKITGYSGFRSYGQLQYPTQKQGKQLQLANKIWQSTGRQADRINPLNNFHYQKTIYKQNHTQNTNPKDYHPEIVPKGGNTTLNFAGNTITKAYDKQESQKVLNGSVRTNLLKTGTEHWKTNYQNQMAKSLSKTQTDSWNPAGRSQSLRKQEQIAKSLSYKNRPYINNCKTGVSEYKFIMGQHIGAKPVDLLDKYSTKQPLINNPLKHGTNQLWTQIPGYQGFKPSQIPFTDLKVKIQDRNAINKGNPKLNLTQNYHVNVPGYSGFKPKYNDLGDQLRSSCFSYK